jgi:serine/threonine protein kinase
MKDKPDIEKVRQIIKETNILEEIASGGFKVVYKALVKKKTEAIKLVKIPTDEENGNVREENMHRVFRELDILVKCSSPHLVKLGSIQPQSCYIDNVEYVLYSEEYIPGKSLRQLIQGGYRPPRDELANLVICMFKAIQELSRQNIIHRDIKPDNIIKTDDKDRSFILLDLGIAFKVGGTRITQDTARIPGSLYYIAPEMLDQGFRQNLDYRSDIYAIGLTAYEFASGTNPFVYREDPQLTTLYRIKNQKPASLEGLRQDLPKELSSLFDQMLRKIPALRPANIANLIRQLEGYL